MLTIPRGRAKNRNAHRVWADALAGIIGHGPSEVRRYHARLARPKGADKVKVTFALRHHRRAAASLAAFVPDLLSRLVGQTTLPDYRQCHVDLFVEWASLHNLVLAVIWNSPQCRGADRSYIIRGQCCGVKEPPSGQASNLRVSWFIKCHAHLRTDSVVSELLTAYPIRKSHKVAEARLVTVKI